MTITTDKVCPSTIGVDIGCGVLLSEVKETHVELQKLDKVIRQYVPSGFSVRGKEHAYAKNTRIKDLRCIKHVNVERTALSISSLGGGNHYIELNQGSDGKIYLVIHTGSRNLGKQIAEYYQKVAQLQLSDMRDERFKIVELLKAQGRQQEIADALKNLSAVKVSKDLAYVSGYAFDDYIHDMKIAQEYADYNRLAIAKEIVSNMGLHVVNQFCTVHNYIDMDTMILRKGAVRASANETLIIPMNMRDGALLCVGKGNPDYNYSAPHGAGRLMSRSKAKSSISMSEYKESMIGIYTTSVNNSTVDEAPQAYKPMAEIVENIKDTVDIVDVIKPIYNYKASE